MSERQFKAYIQDNSVCYNIIYDKWQKQIDLNGQLKYKANYKDSKIDGLEEWYFENGQLEQTISYKDGRPIETTYYKDGKVIKITPYR